MPKKDKRIDAYIAKSQDFARPILNHLRGLVHKACPDVPRIFVFLPSPTCLQQAGLKVGATGTFSLI